MNALLPRFIRLTYRREKISSFVVIVGLVDAVLGGVGERWTLLSFGVLVVCLAIVLRAVQGQRGNASVPVEERPRRYLPPSSSPPPLPTLRSRSRRINN